MSENARYERMPDVELRSIAGEHFLIVLHAGESKMFNLNGAGRWFWERLDAPRRKDELRSALLDTYEVGEDEAGREVDRFLSALADKGLVRRL